MSNLKERLADMSALSQSRTPADALKYIMKLETENKCLKALAADVIYSTGDDPEIMAASRAEWAARALEAEAKLHKTELKLEYATQELKAIEDEPNDPLAPLVMKTIAKFAISELENEDRWVDPKGKYK